MEITVEELRTLAQRGATIINVGKRQGSAEIRGAIRYRPQDLETPDHLALPIAPKKPVVLYDEHGIEESTRRIAKKLRANGFEEVNILRGGFEAWKASNGPTQEPSYEQVVPPSKPAEVQKLDRRL